MGFSNLVLNFLNLDSWSLANEKTGEVVEGQFHAQELTENISARYETHTTFSRQTPNVQFINGEPRTITFEARLFSDALGISDAISAATGSFQTLKERLEMLKSWMVPDSDKHHPPVLIFNIGDGSEISMAECVITSLGGIKYGRPKGTGGMRDVSLSITLLEYNEYKLEDFKKRETRYHNVSEDEYYEMLTFREYQNPQIGDVIRKRHPKQPNLAVGDTVKLPSFPAIQTDKVKQTSVALKTGWGKRDTPQKRLRLQMLEDRNRTYISHIIVED